MTDIFLKLKNIQKKYIDASKNIQVLNGVNLSLNKNNIVSLIGPSGSGKSTLLHILGLLETVDNGEYFFNDVNLIDLMKVIQRDYKLDSYKLDSVAEYFIKEQINKIITLDDNHYKLITKNIVKEGNYIRIEENDESIDDKFIVTEILEDGR